MVSLQKILNLREKKTTKYSNRQFEFPLKLVQLSKRKNRLCNQISKNVVHCFAHNMSRQNQFLFDRNGIHFRKLENLVASGLFTVLKFGLVTTIDAIFLFLNCTISSTELLLIRKSVYCSAMIDQITVNSIH